MELSWSANPNMSSFGYENRYYTWTSKKRRVEKLKRVRRVGRLRLLAEVKEE